MNGAADVPIRHQCTRSGCCKSLCYSGESATHHDVHIRTEKAFAVSQLEQLIGKYTRSFDSDMSVCLTLGSQYYLPSISAFEELPRLKNELLLLTTILGSFVWASLDGVLCWERIRCKHQHLQPSGFTSCTCLGFLTDTWRLATGFCK